MIIGRRERGFSLLEVLVAAAIMIMSMGLILQLFGSGIDRMHRVGTHAKEIVFEREIRARLSTLNPAEQATGSGEFGDWVYDWTAEQLQPYRHVSAQLGEVPYARYVALYRLRVNVTRPDREDYELDVLRLGWRGRP